MIKALFIGALALLALIPIGIVLAVVGLPVIAVLALIAVPLLFVLFLVGLPLLIILAAASALVGATIGVVMAFLSFGVVVLKVTFVVLVPLLILGWVMRNVVIPRSAATRDLL